MSNKDTIFELYPGMTPRQAIFAATRDNLITKTERDLYLLDFPDEPSPDIIVKEEYTWSQCSNGYDPFESKYFHEMLSEEIDANIDFYTPETKKLALAYLKIRGFNL